MFCDDYDLFKGQSILNAESLEGFNRIHDFDYMPDQRSRVRRKCVGNPLLGLEEYKRLVWQNDKAFDLVEEGRFELG